MKTGTFDVLIVDDTAEDMALTLHVLRKLDRKCSLHACENGQEALEILRVRRQSEYPSIRLVLMDLKMPGMDGIETVRCIRAEPAFRNLPVLILSTSREPKDLRAAYDAGVSAYLVKPVRLEELRAMLDGATRFWLEIAEPAPGAKGKKND